MTEAGYKACVGTNASARDLAARVLLDVEKGRGWVRDLLPAAREGLADPRERGLLTELSYGVIRHRGTLDAVLAPASKRPLARLSIPVRTGLRLAVYQILFLDRVPTHAAVDHAVGWVRRRAGAHGGGYANAVLRSVARGVEGEARGQPDVTRDVPREDGSALRLVAPTFPDPAVDPAASLAARYSCPAWLVQRWIDARGASRAEALCRVGIQRPPLALRARQDRSALVMRLKETCASVRAGTVDTAVLVEGAGEAAAVAAVEDGDAWIQDATAQRVAPLLRPRPGQRLLDLCAAPGGKTLHLTDLLDGQGQVVACDVDARKVRGLEALAERVRGDVRLDARLVSREGAIDLEAASFDAILVDAPCTNTGVLRRRVEARWRLKEDDIATLAGIQRGILERALPLLKPGGRLVYTTCSLEPDENGRLVDAFLGAHPEFVEETRVEAPPARDADGGFAAVLRLA